MFDLFSFWSTVTLLSVPALLVFLSIGLLALILMLHKASRGRFDPEDKVNAVQEDKRFSGLFILGLVELAAMLAAFIFFGTTPVAIVTKIATMLAPVGGWATIILLGYVGIFGTARFVFDKLYSLEDRVAETEKRFDEKK